MTRAFIVLYTCLALAGCAPGAAGSGSGPADSRADAATQAACRQRADEIYDRQNRGEIYSPLAGINTPASGSYVPGDDSRGLGQIFARDRTIRDCVRTNGLAIDRDVRPLTGSTGKN